MRGEATGFETSPSSTRSTAFSFKLLLFGLILLTLIMAAMFFLGDIPLVPHLGVLGIFLLSGAGIAVRLSRRALRPQESLLSQPSSSPTTATAASRAPTSLPELVSASLPKRASSGVPVDGGASHRSTSQPIAFNLRTTIEETVSRFSTTSREKGVEISCLFSADSLTLFRGDPGNIRLILLNLLGYAFAHLIKSEITLRETLVQQTPTHGTFRFELTTLSPSSNPQEAPHLDVLTTAHEDPQLSLPTADDAIAISRQLIKTFDGFIEIERTSPGGMTIWFTLTLEKQPLELSSDLFPATSLEGARLLLVSEDPFLTTEEGLAWGLAEYQVTRSSQAWSILMAAVQAGRPYDLMILHCHELDDQSLDFSARVRASSALATLHLVFVANTGKKGDARQIRQAGFAAYLTFPLSASLLFECLTTVLGQPPQSCEAEHTLITRYTLAETRMRERARILVVDSDVSDQKHAVRLIEQLGYRADVASTTHDFLEASARLPYTAILLPSQMAGIDGITTAAEIRQQDRQEGRYTPLIGVLQSQKEQTQTYGFATDTDVIVSKPLLLETLKATIEHCRTLVQQNPTPLLSSTGASDTPAVDLHEALARIEGDKELFDEMTMLFIEEYPKSLLKMHEAVARQDPQALIYSANALKGALGNFAATKAINTTNGLEMMGRQGNLSLALSALTELEQQLSHVHTLLTEFRQQAAA